MPAGRYFGTRPRGTTTKSKNGTPQIVIEFDVTHFWSHGQWEKMPNVLERSVYLSLSDAALPYTEVKLKKMGFNNDFDDPQFAVADSELECKEETYQGKTREKWDIAGGPSKVEKADHETIEQLNQTWRRRNPTPPTGDSIPFLSVLARVWRALTGGYQGARA